MPAPTGVKQLVRYGLNGGAAVILDTSLLALLHGALGVDLLLATLISYVTVLGLHYVVSRRWVFETDRDHRLSGPRYLVVMTLNLLLTLAIVGVLTHAGLYYLAAKLVAIVVSSAINFLALRHWVFHGTTA